MTITITKGTSSNNTTNRCTDHNNRSIALDNSEDLCKTEKGLIASRELKRRGNFNIRPQGEVLGCVLFLQHCEVLKCINMIQIYVVQNLNI